MVNGIATLAQTGAHGSWDAAPLETWRMLAGACLALLAALWVLRALAQGGRYRALGVLGDAERESVRAAIAKAERGTSGELVVVVLERSDVHLSARLCAGLCLALLLALALALGFMSVPPLAELGILAAGLLAGYGLALALPALARSFTGEAQATHAAAEQALVEFQSQGLSETAARTGVLVFVSLYERRAIVMGDKGIHEQVGDAHWSRARDLLLDSAAHGRLCDGIVSAVDECGRVLAQHFPVQEGDQNELPDRLVVRRE
jgi:putative membrane protein